jgi:hypothetical protein
MEGMMKKTGRMTAGIILLVALLTGCEGSAGPGGVTVSDPTRNPSSTLRDTATPSQTLTPTITPTATKVPDLEIVNGRLIDLRSTVGGVYFLGRIRNNTDTPMLLPAREYAFVFNYEDYQTFGDIFWHDVLGPLGLKPGVFEKGGPNCNCILYPREEGVIWYRRSLLDRLDGYTSSREELSKYDGKLGITYSYTSTFIASPDLPTTYHPKAENVEYRIEDGNIFFEYDINVPAPKNKEKEKGMVMGFLIMYDKDGNIINVLYSDIRDFLPYEDRYDRLVHMQGQSPYGDVPVRWPDFLDITKENLQMVDHIEMLFEVQYEGICFDKRYPE